MANLPETATYEAGIYQIETTDPVVGGPNGVSNAQAKQLANRTAWLKAIAEEVIAGRGGKATLGARLDEIQGDVQGLNPDMQNMVAAVIMQAMDLAGLAQKELAKTLSQRMQTGEITVYNRGIISGAVVTKSQTATRNLNLSAGSIFMHGRIFPLSEELNSAAVPANPGGASADCYSYIWIDSNGAVQHDCTALGAAVPSGGLALYRIAVPAGNNEQNDPHLDNCTLTDVRRVEAGYPGMFINAPFTYIALPYNLLGSDYAVDLDIKSFEGSGWQMGYVYVADRLANGFKICLNGTVDAVLVRWTARKLSL
jgi:hypothetical protein